MNSAGWADEQTIALASPEGTGTLHVCSYSVNRLVKKKIKRKETQWLCVSGVNVGPKMYSKGMSMWWPQLLPVNSFFCSFLQPAFCLLHL